MAERQEAVKWTPAGEAFSALIVRILRLHRPLIVAGNELTRPVGQTSARWQVLGVIEHGPATVAQVARAFGLARQSVQRLADALVEDGLAAYERNPRHRRAKLVRLTPAGESALAAILAAQREWAVALGAQIGADDLQRASQVLDRVLRAIEKPRD